MRSESTTTRDNTDEPASPTTSAGTTPVRRLPLPAVKGTMGGIGELRSRAVMAEVGGGAVGGGAVQGGAGARLGPVEGDDGWREMEAERWQEGKEG